MKTTFYRLLAVLGLALAALAAFGYALGYYDITFIPR